MLNLEADGASVPYQPAEGGDYDAPADMTTNVDEAFAEAADRIGVDAPADISGAGDATLSEMPTRAEETSIARAYHKVICSMHVGNKRGLSQLCRCHVDDLP